MPRRPDTPAPTGATNATAGLWLIADMALNVVAVSLVKALGGAYPAWQIVFLRAVVGLVLLGPWLPGLLRAAPWPPRDGGLHLLRVVLSTTALWAGFFALPRLPLALFTTLNFTRPLVLMALAALLLRERVAPRRWLAAITGLVGVVIAAGPVGAGTAEGLAAVALAVLAGTGAVIVTRRLRDSGHLAMMAVYTAGLAGLTAPFAALDWVPVAPVHWPLLLAVGLFAQAAQACFLRAHALGEAGFLAPLGYLSLIVSGIAGFVAFGEVPGWSTVIGAAVIAAATLPGISSARRRPDAAVAGARPLG